MVPNTFTYNEVDYTVNSIVLFESYDYVPGTSDYAQDLYFGITPALGEADIAAWKFVTPDGEFAFADAMPSVQGGQQLYIWPSSGLNWDNRRGTPFPVSITGLPGTDGQRPEVDGPPGIKLSWSTRTLTSFGDFSSIPTKVGFTIHRSQRHEWGNYGSGQQQIGEVLKCDIAESGGAQSCLTIGTVGAFVTESWTWTDETAQSGVSYLYTIKPYHEFYSTNGTSVWTGNIVPIVSSVLAAPADRLRVHGRASNVSHRMPHPDAPGTPPNLTASQPNSGTCTGSCVRLTWNPAPNATKYVVFRTGQRTRETWVDYGLTYPQRFTPADLTATEWEDTSAEPGVRYTYRVAAFNEDGLRNATDAAIAFETPGGTTVPNKVPNLTADATRTSATSAAVTLEWTAPEGISSVPNAKYLIEYRLNIPQRAEWEEDWKTVAGNVSATATSYSHTIALEKYYSRGNRYPTGAPTISGTVAQGETLTANTSGISDPDGLTSPGFSYQWLLNGTPVSGETGSTFGPLADRHVQGNIALRVSFTDDKGKRESLVSGASTKVDPFEYVPTADKRTLRLHDSDAENDLILPFGINYEYRVRAVKGTNKGLPADATVRIPNQDGLQSVVIIEFVELGSCAMWEHVTDADGNDPTGYRVLFASSARRFHQASVVRDYLSHVTEAPSPGENPHCVTGGYSWEEWQGYNTPLRIPDTEVTYWLVVQAYDDNGIAKGDGTGGRRSRGSAEIMKWIDKESDEYIPAAKGSGAETVGSGDDSE